MATPASRQFIRFRPTNSVPSSTAAVRPRAVARGPSGTGPSTSARVLSQARPIDDFDVQVDYRLGAGLSAPVVGSGYPQLNVTPVDHTGRVERCYRGTGFDRRLRWARRGDVLHGESAGWLSLRYRAEWRGHHYDRHRPPGGRGGRRDGYRRRMRAVGTAVQYCDRSRP